MRIILFCLFVLFLIINSGNCQEMKPLLLESSIKNYQKYLLDNPRTPHLKEITDSLRLMWDRQNIKNFHTFCNSNCLEVFMNSKDKILFEEKEIDKSELKELIYYSIKNPNNRQDLPEKRIVKTDLFGDFYCSTGVVDIITNDANPELYSDIIVLVKDAFMEIRKEWARYMYSQDYLTLSERIKKDIDIIIPIKIRFERYMPWNLRLPPLPTPNNLKKKDLSMNTLTN